jgi:nitric oxide reductase subunit C
VAVAALCLHGDAVLFPPARAATGDAARGASLFARLPCASCHDVARPSPGGDVCPNLGTIAADAERRIASPDYHGKATDVADYIRESILDANAYIVPGENYRTPAGQSVMPAGFGATLSPTDVDDLVAFLSTRR